MSRMLIINWTIFGSLLVQFAAAEQACMDIGLFACSSRYVGQVVML